MQNLIKYISIFLLMILFMYAFSDSYTSHCIDNLAYVIAIGVDATDNDKMQVSFQFVETSVFSEQGASKGSGTVVNTVEANSIDAAINLLNSYVGKQVNISHCKVIVFSEELAKKGLTTTIYSLINNSELRPTTNIVISKCDAKYYIENSTSSYEKIITKYYDIFPKSAEYTGYIANATIGNFFNQLSNTSSNPIAILGGINTQGFSDSVTDFNVTPNDSNITGERGSECIGLAVFKGDTLVGELTAIETLCHSIIGDEVNTFLVSIPDPENTNNFLDISLSAYKKPKIDIDISTGSPHINIDICLNGRILTMNTDTNYLDEQYLNIIDESTNLYLESRISEYLYRTSTEFKACIDNFDKHAMHSFLTISEWEDYDWNSNYQNAFFNVNVDTNINSSLLLKGS